MALPECPYLSDLARAPIYFSLRMSKTAVGLQRGQKYPKLRVTHRFVQSEHCESGMVSKDI